MLNVNIPTICGVRESVIIASYAFCVYIIRGTDLNSILLNIRIAENLY